VLAPLIAPILHAAQAVALKVSMNPEDAAVYQLMVAVEPL